MEPKKLILRCYAEQKNGYWQAFCVDLCLATQGDSFADVKSKLHEQIADYLYDILEGEDSQYAEQLLNRKAPLYQVAKFKTFEFLSHYRSISSRIINGFQAFNELMPVKLAAA